MMKKRDASMMRLYDIILWMFLKFYPIYGTNCGFVNR